jgi:diaminopimelate epimerase
MSGNGSRCAASYLHFEGLWTAEELRFQTRAGVKRYVLRERTGEGSFRFEAEIGRPRFDSASVPILTPEPLEEVRDHPLALAGGERVAVTALQMCNPNCCVFVEDFDGMDWRRLGRALESHAAFPERTNVEFVRVLDRQKIEARVWERGAGETLSSGTGACAAAVASMVGGRTDRHVGVRMPGGTLEVLWRGDGEVLLTGTAEVVYRGEWLGEGRGRPGEREVMERGDGETGGLGDGETKAGAMRASYPRSLAPSPRLQIPPSRLLRPFKTPLLPACGGANIAANPSNTVWRRDL